MGVSRQSEVGEKRGPRARTGRLMLETAIRLMQAGATPSVSEVAEAAGVSRATAYRYFPSQAALVQAVVDAGLGPILKWKSASSDPQRRMAALLDTSIPRIDAFEATFKAALKLALEQWAHRHAGTPEAEPRFTRGHRKELLAQAMEPLKSKLPSRQFERLLQSLSLVFGVELLVVLKDIWGADADEARLTAKWAAQALIRAAQAEADTKETLNRVAD